MSERHIAFAYANNIWVVGRDGGDAKRLTSFQGSTGNPELSPDGNWVSTQHTPAELTARFDEPFPLGMRPLAEVVTVAVRAFAFTAVQPPLLPLRRRAAFNQELRAAREPLLSREDHGDGGRQPRGRGSGNAEVSCHESKCCLS